MFLRDINPFIRTAFIHAKFPLNIFVTCADCRLFYILSGSGKLTIKNNTFEFKKDSLFLWKSGTKYKWEFSKNNIPKLGIINFDYNQDYRQFSTPFDLILNDCDDEILTTPDILDMELLNDVIVFENAGRFKNDVMEIIENCENTSQFSKALAEANLKRLIIKLIQYITEGSTPVTKLSPILEYIHENYNSDISNKTLAEIVSYHPHHVNLLMKKHTGKTLHAYITQYRMNEALKMLANTDKSIEAIANETGYKNPSHFHKIFKLTYGLSPSEYRKSTNII